MLAELAFARPPTLGGGRLVCVDGPAGSGKTTLAAAVARLVADGVAGSAGRGSVRVVHLDDMYDGWTGLPRLTAQLDDLLHPLSRGEPGSYRRYDWVAEQFAERVTVAPVELLILEGVGAGSRAHAPLATVLTWVWAPAELRLSRGLQRDGRQAEPHWRQWMRDEATHHARERTRARADVLVDGTGIRPPAVVRA